MLIIIGESTRCAVDNGILIHAHRPGCHPFDLLEERCPVERLSQERLAKESAEELADAVIKKSQGLDTSVVAFGHRDRSEQTQVRMMEIESILRRAKPDLIILNSPSLLTIFFDKWHFYDFVQSNRDLSFLVPWHKLIESDRDIERIFKTHHPPILLKARSLASGKGLERVSSARDARKFFHLAQSGRTRQGVWQNLKNRWHALKNPSRRTRIPIPILASGLVNTFSSTENAYINACVFFYLGRIQLADCRIHRRSFNIHASDGYASSKELPKPQFERITSRVMNLIHEHQAALEALARQTSFLALRMDLLIDYDNAELRIAEFAMKGGPGPHARELHQYMESNAWPLERIIRLFGQNTFTEKDLLENARILKQ